MRQAIRPVILDFAPGIRIQEHFAFSVRRHVALTGRSFSLCPPLTLQPESKCTNRHTEAALRLGLGGRILTKTEADSRWAFGPIPALREVLPTLQFKLKGQKKERRQ